MKTKTLREKIHTITSIEGCISSKAIQIMDGTQNYKHKLVYELKEKNLLEKHKKVWCMTRAGIEDSTIWRDKIPEKYKWEAGNAKRIFVKSSKGEARRHMYQSEILAVMLEAGVNLWEKDEFPGRDVVDDLYIRAVRVKRMCLEDKKTVKRSKALGTLFGSKENLCIYNVFGEIAKPIQFDFLSEMQYKELTETKYMEKERKPIQAEAILFVSDLMNFDGLIGANIGQGGLERIASIYEKVYVFPESRAGSILFALMLHPDFKNVTEKIAAEQEAADFLLPELRTLRRYYCTGEKRICCMVEYVQMVKRVFPEAEVIGITIEEMVEELQVL